MAGVSATWRVVGKGRAKERETVRESKEGVSDHVSVLRERERRVG